MFKFTTRVTRMHANTGGSRYLLTGRLKTASLMTIISHLDNNKERNNDKELKQVFQISLAGYSQSHIQIEIKKKRKKTNKPKTTTLLSNTKKPKKGGKCTPPNEWITQQKSETLPDQKCKRKGKVETAPQHPKSLSWETMTAHTQHTLKATRKSRRKLKGKKDNRDE